MNDATISLIFAQYGYLFSCVDCPRLSDHKVKVCAPAVARAERKRSDTYRSFSWNFGPNLAIFLWRIGPFIDGTAKAICLPNILQRKLNSGCPTHVLIHSCLSFALVAWIASAEILVRLRQNVKVKGCVFGLEVQSPPAETHKKMTQMGIYRHALSE